MTIDPAFIPVIIGTGQINDRDCAHDSLGLMVAALEKADADAGGGWIAALDSLAVVNQISFPALGNCAEGIAAHFGIAPAHIEQTPWPTGESPVQLLNEAANRIGAGEIQVAAVVGGEALRTAAQRAKAATGERQDALRSVANSGAQSLMARHGLVAPTDLYPLYENATRAAWGQSFAEAESETGALWSGMSAVAARNETAWLRKALSPEEITASNDDNRPIAYPYLKRMVANSSVNQGAAFIVTSLARARSAGIAEDRIIYVGQGAAAHETHAMLKRDRYDRSAGMIMTLEKTLERNRLTAADLTHVELYSCFPCIPKMARRLLDWPVERPITAFGGLTFGGGPIGNYMSHAIGSMVDTLRQTRGLALLFANGGYATHNHAIVISTSPIAAAIFPSDFDFNADAAALRDPVPAVVEDYEGAAIIETYTVFYRRDGSIRFGTVIGRTPEGARLLARVEAGDDKTLAMLLDRQVEPIGTNGMVHRDAEGLLHWRTV
jgi:acetyl-CoA C-acetyltransferase